MKLEVPYRQRLFGLTPCLLALFALGCGKGDTGKKPGEPSHPLMIFAAASTADAIDEIRAKFSVVHGTATRTNYAASSTLAQQIVQGAEADLFLSANESWADELAKAGFVAERRNLLGNELVIVVPRDSTFEMLQIGDLEDPRVKRIALGDPDSVPAGTYARQALVKLGLWDSLKSKVVAATDVRQALSFVETSAADVGIVFATDAQASSKDRVALRIDPALTEPIRYPLVLVKQSPLHPEAKAFYDFFGGPTAAEIFRRHGFQVLDAATPK